MTYYYYNNKRVNRILEDSCVGELSYINLYKVTTNNIWWFNFETQRFECDKFEEMSYIKNECVLITKEQFLYLTQNVKHIDYWFETVKTLQIMSNI